MAHHANPIRQHGGHAAYTSKGRDALPSRSERKLENPLMRCQVLQKMLPCCIRRTRTVRAHLRTEFEALRSERARDWNGIAKRSREMIVQRRTMGVPLAVLSLDFGHARQICTQTLHSGRGRTRERASSISLTEWRSLQGRGAPLYAISSVR